MVESPSNAAYWSSMQFNMADMQRFHHFLTTAASVLPSERPEVWTMELPQVAHQVWRTICALTSRRRFLDSSRGAWIRLLLRRPTLSVMYRTDMNSMNSLCTPSYLSAVRTYQLLVPREKVHRP